MSRLVTLVLFFFTLFLIITVTAQDPTTPTPTADPSTPTPDPTTPTPTADPSSTAGAGDTPTPTPTVPSSDTGSATTTPPTSTVTVSSSSSSSSSSSTGTISNGTNTNTTVTPPTTPPTTATGRVACPGNDALTEALRKLNDLPPWNCPRLDVDGGALGPGNNYDPCRSLTKRIDLQRNGTVTTEPDVVYVCTQAPVAGLNSSQSYSTKEKLYTLPTLVTKGEVYPVAIVTSNVLFNKKMIFQPLVDSFTSLEIAASHGVQWFSVPNTFISLEAGGLTSGPRTRIFRIPALDGRGSGAKGEKMAQNYWNNSVDPEHPWIGKNYGIVPFWTVLINVDNGRITSINWDEGCDACADQLCSPDGNCGVDEYSCALVNGTTTRDQKDIETLPEYDIRTLSDCARDAARDYGTGTNMTWDPTKYARVRAAADSCIASKQILSNTQPDSLSKMQENQQRIPKGSSNTDCGIKIYLGWTGTDQNGKFFTSAGKRLSVFRKYSIGAAFNSASQYVDQQLPEAPVDPNAQ